MLSNNEQIIKLRPTVEFDGAALLVGLAPIAESRLFCTWCLESNSGNPEKPKKVPYVRGGRRMNGGYADSALPSKLMTLQEAIDAGAKLNHAGVGLVFYPGCCVVGLDLDHCVDPVAGFTLTSIQKDALRVFQGNAFIEYSQSGTGLHAIALGNSSTDKANGLVEVFGDKNFLALTGAKAKGVAEPLDIEKIGRLSEIVGRAKAMQKPKNVGVNLLVVDAVARHATTINADALDRPQTVKDPDRAASALAAIPSPADRDEWRNIAWAFCDAGGRIEEAIKWSYPGSENDLRTIWNSYDPNHTGGISSGTLFKAAINNGWRSPTSSAVVVTGDAAHHEPANDQKAQVTDLWLSNKFVTIIALELGLKYDHSAKAWRIWRAGSWQLCLRGEQIEAMKALAQLLMMEALRQQQIDPLSDRTKKLMGCAHRAQSAQGIKSALELSQSSPSVATSAEAFDSDPNLLNVANGVIDLRTGELQPHDRAQMMFRQSPIHYDQAAKCPWFEAFMQQISCNDGGWVDFLQRMLGYELSGNVGEEKLFFWLGKGANGKSVLGNVQAHILGSYAGVAPAAFLMTKRGDGGGATPDMANLVGKRLVVANEVEAGSNMSGQTIKVVVSPEAITARRLYGAPFTFKPTHKLNIRGNHRPIITDNDEGLWRRMVLIPFDLDLAPEQRDQKLEARLIDEAPGILAWMVRGFQKWQLEGLRPARRVLDASLAYRNESDLLGQWVTDCCEVGHDASGTFSAVQQSAYTTYRLWCHEQGLKQYSKKAFTRGLFERGYSAGRQGGGERKETYIGFKLTGAHR